MLLELSLAPRPLAGFDMGLSFCFNTATENNHQVAHGKKYPALPASPRLIALQIQPARPLPQPLKDLYLFISC